MVRADRLAVHLFSLLVPALGAADAGLAMGLVTAMAITGLALISWAMPAGIDQRLVASESYAVHISPLRGIRGLRRH